MSNPIIIPTKDGVYQATALNGNIYLKNPNGEIKSIEQKDFEKFLVAHVPRMEKSPESDTLELTSSNKIPPDLTREERIEWIKSHGGPGLKTNTTTNDFLGGKSLIQQLALSNPYLNPMGCFLHIINPSQGPTVFDNPMLNFLI